MTHDSWSRTLAVLVAVLTIGMFASSCSEDPATTSETDAKVEAAETVYTNGKIYTVNTKQPWAEAVAIKDGKFVAVGSNTDIKGMIGDGTEVIDLKGGFAMPGIGDSHIHPALLMVRRAFCALPGTFFEPSEEEIIAALKECIANYPQDR